MPSSDQAIYETASNRLEAAWNELERTHALPDLDPALTEKITAAVNSPENSPRYALITQLLRKSVAPAADCRRLRADAGAPSGRALAKNVVAPFDQAHGSPLGGSRDPYVSNPLRRVQLDESVLEDSSHSAEWHALIDVLTAAEEDASIVEIALTHAVAAMMERVHSLRSLLQRGLAIQGELFDAAEPHDLGHERRELLEGVAPNVVRPLLDHGLDVEGSAGSGSPAEVPWIRVFSPEQSPSAQRGWYLAYLFAADGSAVYLSLLQGVTEGESLEAAATRVRQSFQGRSGFVDEIDLHSAQANASARPALYERATAFARKYQRDALPPAEQLEEDLEAMSAMLLDVYAREGQATGGGRNVRALTVEAVVAELARDHVEFPIDLIRAAVAAVRAGQHLLLTGPPGTGKTSLAVALARAAAAQRICAGFDTVTATADWSSAETIGGYWPEPDGTTLRFRPGHVLSAIDAERWVILDELNRADIDKAFGPLFTVLSGQSVQLPQLEQVDGDLVPVEITPDEDSSGAVPSAHRVPPGWRMIATLNTRDRDLLFNLSYALLRRFAVIDVPVPRPDEYAAILNARADTGNAELNRRLHRLSRLPHRPLGPAILIDAGKFLRERVALDASVEVNAAGLMSEALTAFVLPQLDDLTRTQQAEVTHYLHQHVLVDWTLDEVRQSVVTVFDLAGTPLPSARMTDPTDGGGLELGDAARE